MFFQKKIKSLGINEGSKIKKLTNIAFEGIHSWFSMSTINCLQNMVKRPSQMTY